MLLECLASLEAQTWKDFQTVVVDNSGRGAIHRLGAARFKFRLIENAANAGFGEAVNQGWRLLPADYLAVLNDDAVAGPGWIESLVKALEARPDDGMAASRIVLKGTERLDSAGLGVARDGSSKQVGRMREAASEARMREALIPSGCAAMYRAKMLDEIGMFDSRFFLYCEDTDLALRAQWAGWRCVYVPEAVVEHAYSASAGRVSPLKAYLVERNRLRVVVKSFPALWAAAAPAWSVARYALHVAAMLKGEGKAGEFARSGQGWWMLPWSVLKAHAALVAGLPGVLRQRAEIRRTRKITAGEFTKRMREHGISLREVAGQ
jgi:hypothetical protein